MFGLFKKKKAIKIRDVIWKNEAVKYLALIDAIGTLDKCIIVYFFDDTKQHFIDVLQHKSIAFDENANASSAISLIKYDKITSTTAINNRPIIFIEHHPSFSKEENIKNSLLNEHGIEQIQFYSSLEDHLFQLFGAERILSLMEKMGYKDNEVIEHSMISNSIVRAQQKLDSEINYASDTKNRLDWFKINLPANGNF